MVNNAWFIAKGAPYNTGCVDDNFYAYMKAKSGISSGSFNDCMLSRLTALGYTTGSLTDRLYAFYGTKTSNTGSYDDRETAFFNNNALDFA